MEEKKGDFYNRGKGLTIRSHNQQRINVMPYRNNADLPDSVKSHLPEHARDIYREAFNHAWDEYAEPDTRRTPESREEVAHKVAWSAVKQNYHKEGERWVLSRKAATSPRGG
jgi:cation transport regulator